MKKKKKKRIKKGKKQKKKKIKKKKKINGKNKKNGRRAYYLRERGGTQGVLRLMGRPGRRLRTGGRDPKGKVSVANFNRNEEDGLGDPQTDRPLFGDKKQKKGRRS